MNTLNGKRRRVRKIKQTATTENEWSTQEAFIGGYLLHISTHSIYRMRLNFRGTKLSRIVILLNIRGFYFRGCWERIDMVDHLIIGKLRN